MKPRIGRFQKKDGDGVGGVECVRVDIWVLMGRGFDTQYASYDANQSSPKGASFQVKTRFIYLVHCPFNPMLDIVSSTLCFFFFDAFH